MNKIFFQGSFGAYSHLAALSIEPNAEIVPCKTFDECFLRASKDTNSKIIIPESNRITGNIGIEYLIFEYRLNIYSEYFQKIENLEKTSHRQNVLKGNMGQTIIDNSFNSNPISNLASLELLHSYETNGKKYLITPGMVELGSEQFTYNYEFAFNASEIIDEALVVGFTNKTSLTLAFEDNNVPVKFFKNRDLAVSYLNSVVKDNDVVLFENDLPDHHP